MSESDQYTLEQLTRKLETSVLGQKEKAKATKGVHVEKLRKKKNTPEVKQSIRFRADIKRDGVMYFLGRFHSFEEAKQCREDAEKAWKHWERNGFDKDAKPDYVVNKESKIFFKSLTPQKKKVRKKPQGYLGRPIPVDTLYLKDEDLEEWQMEYMRAGMIKEGYLTAKQRKLMRERQEREDAPTSLQDD